MSFSMTSSSPFPVDLFGAADVHTRRKSRGIKHQVLVGGILMPLLFSFPSVSPFSRPLFFPAGTTPKIIESPRKSVDFPVDLPNFDELFDRIKEVSPLAKMALEGKEGGFRMMDVKDEPKWKLVDSNQAKTVHRIEKIDNFQNLGCPVIRFRSSLEGPCIPELFANFITKLEERKKWDKQIAAVDNIHTVENLDAATEVISHDYGKCTALGVGYCATKPNPVVPSREQLTLCGIQEFADGASVIWGTEMHDKHNHLFPPGKRHTRARSHLFSTTLMPTGPNAFDVEYVLQMDIGGKIPAFLTTPVLIDTVKTLFNHAKQYFNGGEGSEIAMYLTELAEKHALLSDKMSLLLAP